jgi:hypothetical protein
MNMDKNYIFGIGIVLAALLIFTAPAAAENSVYFEPDPSSAAIGETITVTMWVNTINGTAGFQDDLYFDPTVVNITEITPGYYNSYWMVIPYYEQNFIRFGGDSPDFHDHTGVMILANVTLEAIGSGTCALGHDEYPAAMLYDEYGYGVPDQVWYDGTFNCPCSAPTYTVSGYTDPAADQVKITNMDKLGAVDERPADYIDPATGFYNLTLDVPGEAEVGDVLRITACEALDEYESNCNVTNHTVVNAPGEDVNVNLTLNHYCLDLTGFPMYEAEAVGDPADYNKGCGPAVAKMWLDYMHNSTTQWDGTHFGDMPAKTQAQLYDWGIGNNSNTSLPYLDTQGMWYTVQYLDPEPYSEYGYNFGKYSSTDQDYMVKQICKWLSYAPGKKPGHPVHVPGAVPAFGNYENWMAVRGIHTSEDAYPLPADLLVYGLWVNDPYPASLGGIGENSYKTIAEWNTTYYLPLDVPGDAYDGKYVGILEPPGDNVGEITIVPSKARFADAITPALEENSIRILFIRKTVRERRLMIEEINKIVQAAKDGANEQLVPYDDNFAEVFAGTEPGMPKFVSSDNGDYYLVPFGERPIVAMNTLVVVRVDAEDGRFLEASWVSEPEQYLPVSFVKAVRLSLNEMGIYRLRDMIRTIRSEQLTIELVYTGGSPYYPEWKITIGDDIYFVNQ